MDKQPTVVFRNVGQVYFPQTRVECHYSLTPDHRWSSSDWIGIFEVGCTSLKKYYTYTWALVPEGYTEGTSVNCCAIFQSFYLPCPSTVEYQFVYVNRMGKACARSRPFTFCAPKPLDELETLQEERDEELLLVVPRAQLLQSQLEECLKKQADIQQALDKTKRETESGKENSERARMEWEREKEAMKEEICELRDHLRQNCDTLKRMEGKHEDVKYSQESMTSELSRLEAEKQESQQRIRELEEDAKVLNLREKERNVEMDRLKERLKKMSSQMKHDEEKRKSLQAESEAALAEARGLQGRLEVSEHMAESLRRELRELSTRQGHAHTELHQARLQVAQLTLQLSEEDLVLREERANWALEREAHKHAAEADKKKIQELICEVQRKEEWLQEERLEREKLELELGSERNCNRVLLGDAKRELQELKAALRRSQREKEEQQEDRQGLVDYIHHFEQRLDIVPHNPPKEDSPDSSCEDDEDASSGSQGQAERAGTHIRSEEDTQGVTRQRYEKSDERKQLILQEFVDPVLSGMADYPMW